MLSLHLLPMLSGHGGGVVLLKWAPRQEDITSAPSCRMARHVPVSLPSPVGGATVLRLRQFLWARRHCLGPWPEWSPVAGDSQRRWSATSSTLRPRRWFPSPVFKRLWAPTWLPGWVPLWSPCGAVEVKK
ncbi:hypothetical protein SETIT_8G108700v2 [Setaria italica]|uniref:Uncharacterized protein n=1 Tax=Setaria italica TaxID=4555 RepID=A0A368S842_SETIT|nr:hypothetical protein SETIT_8G108700v2 [Setaria italica]